MVDQNKYPFLSLLERMQGDRRECYIRELHDYEKACLAAEVNAICDETLPQVEPLLKLITTSVKMISENWSELYQSIPQKLRDEIEKAQK